MRHLQYLAAWCKKHGAGQLAELHLQNNFKPAAAAEAERIVLRILRPEASSADAAAAAASDSAAEDCRGSSSSSVTAKHQLQLRAFSTSYLYTPNVVAALPAATLTRLKLSASVYGHHAESSAFAAPLARLVNLQQLQLHHLDLDSSCFEAIGSLAQLTKLTCSTASSSAAAMSHLPPQLLELDIGLSGTPAAAAAEPAAEAAEQAVGQGQHEVSLQLAHITALQSLHISNTCHLRESHLPASITELLVMSSCASSALPPLTALNLRQLPELKTLRVVYEASVDSAQQLLHQLAPLKQLQWISLEYSSFNAAQHAAAAWRGCSALQHLTIYGIMDEDDDDDDQIPADLLLEPEHVLHVLQGIGAATSLQALEITGVVPADVVDVARHLTGLTRLQVLELHTYNSSSQDLLHLRALAPTLTSLSFRCPQVDDLAVVGLSCRLQRLQRLSLLHHSMKSSAALLALSMLSELQELDLRGCPGPFDGHVLMELAAALPQLQQLEVTSGQFTLEDLQAFWDATGRRVAIKVSPL
jgi:hypothetical protein